MNVQFTSLYMRWCNAEKVKPPICLKSFSFHVLLKFDVHFLKPSSTHGCLFFGFCSLACLTLTLQKDVLYVRMRLELLGFFCRKSKVSLSSNMCFGQCYLPLMVDLRCAQCWMTGVCRRKELFLIALLKLRKTRAREKQLKASGRWDLSFTYAGDV